jgi:Bacterial regulatory proteins, luxR family
LLTFADTLYLSIKTIETHRAHIKEKLGVHDSEDLALYDRLGRAAGVIFSHNTIRSCGELAEGIYAVRAPNAAFPMGNQHNPRPRIRAVRVRRSGQ